jgi:hypothetical protein
MANRNKETKERVNKMNTAWAQGAPTVTFNGVTQTAFEADITAAAAAEQEIADLEAQLKLKKIALEERYKQLADKSTKVRDGIEGDANFGQEHPLLGAMGFVRPSERKSGLTRKKNQPTPPTS